MPGKNLTLFGLGVSWVCINIVRTGTKKGGSLMVGNIFILVVIGFCVL